LHHHLKETNKDSILATYGGEEYLQKAPKELLLGQTEDYVEYSQSGQVLKGLERAKAKSKYHEDVYINNHTAVWGSWYDPSTGQWGYACCHSIIHISYCSGRAGIEATHASSAQHLLSSSKPAPEPSIPVPEPSQEAEERRIQAQRAYSKDRLGEGQLKLSETRLAAALREEKKRKANGEEWSGTSGKRKKGEDSHDVTEEQLEAYRMNRNRAEDPMANYLDKEV